MFHNLLTFKRITKWRRVKVVLLQNRGSRSSLTKPLLLTKVYVKGKNIYDCSSVPFVLNLPIELEGIVSNLFFVI